MPKGPKPMPVRVRGQDFASAHECAEHFGISVSTVWAALHKGRPDSIGMGKKRPNNGGASAKQLKVGNHVFESYAAASKALGYHHKHVATVMRTGTATQKQKLMGKLMKWVAEQEAEREDSENWKRRYKGKKNG